MHGHLACAVFIGANRFKSLAHHPKGLPEKKHENRAIDQRKQAVEHGDRSERTDLGREVWPGCMHSSSLFWLHPVTSVTGKGVVLFGVCAYGLINIRLESGLCP